MLLKVSQLVCDCPEVAELDINPLLADDRGVVALDARVRVQPASGTGAARLAIRPYPAELEEWLSIGGRRVLARPVRPDDEARLKAFFAGAEPRDLRLRFFMTRRELAHSELARFSQLDYEREMAFIAVLDEPGESGESGGMLGEVRVATDPDNQRAEFALMVRPDMQRQGLGRAEGQEGHTARHSLKKPLLPGRRGPPPRSSRGGQARPHGRVPWVGFLEFSINHLRWPEKADSNSAIRGYNRPRHAP